jgi:predicted MFS family arabinose efflux permease
MTTDVRVRWLAVASVAVGIFTLVTAEQLPVGLLAPISSALHVSEGTAGLLVAVPGIVAGIAAPLVPVLARTVDRRQLLIGLLLAMAVAQLMSTVSPNFSVLLLSRVLVGLSIGGFWAIAGGLAVRLVPAADVPRATALIFGGVGAASVLGVPAGAMLGQLSGWRVAFAVLAALGLAVAGAMVALLPPLPAGRPVELRELAGRLRERPVAAGVVATFLLVTGHFVAYTFVVPVLGTVSGISTGAISPLLLGYGVAGVVGNFLAGAATGRNVRRTVVVIAVVLAATVGLFPLVGRSPITGIALLIVWGLGYGGVSVTLQSWMLAATAKGASAEPATALYTAMFNLSIAAGAAAGGAIVDALSLTSILWLSGGLFATSLLVGVLAPGVKAAPVENRRRTQTTSG